MNTKDVGNTTEAMVLAALVKAGHAVLVPWGDNLRYDLAIDDAGKLLRIQCKTGRYQHGAVEFAACSSTTHRKAGKKQTYHGQADFFGVYCPQLDTVYFVPIKDVGVSTGILRVEAPKNSQVKKIRWAKDYETL
jgi:hypothetical protein